MTKSATVLLNRLQSKARLRHLQVLVKIGELRNLKHAAEALGLSQPAVTHLLADLEALVEMPLCERHSRGVRMTEAGHELIPLARRMLDTLASGAEAITAMKLEGEGVVRLAAITGAISGLLVRAVPAFAKLHPRIQLQVMESDVEQWGLQLTRGEVDLIASRQPPSLPAAFAFRPVLGDHFVIACGTQHPLAGRSGVRWSTLVRELWLPAPVGSSARRVFDELVAESGEAPSLCQVITRVSSLTWALLQSERMVTLVPYGVVRQLVEANQLALVGTERAIPFEPLGLIVPEAARSATLVFADFVEQFGESERRCG